MTTNGRPRPMALIVLDGWGISPTKEADATSLARTPTIKALFGRYPNGRLEAAGEAVGLMPGVIGNSEVGHLNLGAGRVVEQDLLTIHRSIQNGSFFKSEAFLETVGFAKRHGGRLHLVGLCSDAGVHSDLSHLEALLELAHHERLDRVYLHALTDGRDSAPNAGAGYLERVRARMRDLGTGEIASVAGRYYTMDRDKRWERTQRGYDAMVLGKAPLVDDAIAAVRRSYAEGKTDEFIEPVCVRGPGGAALARVEDGDGIIFFNYRADRARQLTRALVDPAFDGFERPKPLPQIAFAGMTRYEEGLPMHVAFPPKDLRDTLGEVVARAGMTQLRVAETEKYAHVTYFFSGGDEAPFQGEERIMVPSRRDVATYDLAPEMRAKEITDEALARLTKGPCPDLIVLNYANADMVGHTGKLDETCRAVEAVDGGLGRLLEGILALGGAAFVTADHGNCEQMRDPVTGEPHTAHTTNPVPAILVDPSRKGVQLASGKLGDVAPTLLELMGMPKPKAMTGTSLLRTVSARK